VQLSAILFFNQTKPTANGRVCVGVVFLCLLCACLPSLTI